MKIPLIYIKLKTKIEKDGIKMDVQKVTLEISTYIKGEYGDTFWSKVFYVNLKDMTHDEWKQRAIKELNGYEEGFEYLETDEYCYSSKVLDSNYDTEFILHGTFKLEEGKHFDIELGLIEPRT